MSMSADTPRVEDLASVGTRVSWGAIFAGAALALGTYFLLGSLGAATGLAVSDRVRSSSLETGTVAWAFLTTAVALFVGGLVTSLYTVGENKTEAVMSGIITWAVVFSVLAHLAGVGVRTGFHAMHADSGNATAHNWEASAREAGVSAEQIDTLRRSIKPQEPQDQQASLEAAKRIAWYTFAGVWISMLAAALGAYVGAGPTFRLVTVPGVGRTVIVNR
jgi:hypothetical protein